MQFSCQSFFFKSSFFFPDYVYRVRARRCNFDYFLRFLLTKFFFTSKRFGGVLSLYFFKNHFLLNVISYLTFSTLVQIYFSSFKKRYRNRVPIFSSRFFFSRSLNSILFNSRMSFFFDFLEKNDSANIFFQNNICFQFFFFFSLHFFSSFCLVSKNFLVSCFSISRTSLNFRRYSKFFFSKAQLRLHLFSLLPSVNSFSFFIFFLNFRRYSLFHDTRERRFLFSESPILNFYFSLSSFYKKRFEMREYFYTSMYSYSSFLSAFTSFNFPKMRKIHFNYVTELYDDRKDFNFISLHPFNFRPQPSRTGLGNVSRKSEFFSFFEFLDEDFFLFSSLLPRLEFIKKEAIVLFIQQLFSKIKDLTFFFFFKLSQYKHANYLLKSQAQSSLSCSSLSQGLFLFFPELTSALNFSFFSLFFSFCSNLFAFCFRAKFFNNFITQTSCFFPLRQFSYSMIGQSRFLSTSSTFLNNLFFQSSKFIRRSFFFFYKSQKLSKKQRPYRPRALISFLSFFSNKNIKKKHQKILFFCFLQSWSLRCLRYGSFPLHRRLTTFLLTRRFKSLSSAVLCKSSWQIRFLGRPRRRISLARSVLISFKKLARSFFFLASKPCLKLDSSFFRRKINNGSLDYLASKLSLLASKFSPFFYSSFNLNPIFEFTRFLSMSRSFSRLSIWRKLTKTELSLDLQLFGRIRSPIQCNAMLLDTTQNCPVLSFSSFFSGESFFSAMYLLSFLRIFTVPQNYYFTHLDHRRLHFTETREFNFRFSQHDFEYNDENPFNFQIFLRKQCTDFFMQNWFPIYSDIESFFGFFFTRSGIFFRHLLSSLSFFLVQTPFELKVTKDSHFFFFNSLSKIPLQSVPLFSSFFYFSSFLDK